MRRGGVREAGAAPRGEGTGPHSAKSWTPASCPCNAQPSSRRVHGRLRGNALAFRMHSQSATVSADHAQLTVFIGCGTQSGFLA